MKWYRHDIITNILFTGEHFSYKLFILINVLGLVISDYQACIKMFKRLDKRGILKRCSGGGDITDGLGGYFGSFGGGSFSGFGGGGIGGSAGWCSGGLGTALGAVALGLAGAL